MFEGLASAQPLALTLYTDAFVVRGTYSTRHRRVTDILNGADTQFLVLADVTIDEFGSSVQAQRTDYAQVNLASVLFAVADGELEALPELRTPKVAATALISVPPFKITGSIHLLPIADLREALGELTGAFVPATDATFWSDSLGEPHTKASLVAFNHARAQILAPHREVDPWAVPASGEMSTQAADTPRSNGW